MSETKKARTLVEQVRSVQSRLVNLEARAREARNFELAGPLKAACRELNAPSVTNQFTESERTNDDDER